MNSKDDFSFQFIISIKVFTSLYKFKNQIINKEKESLSGQVILLDKDWFSKYKKFYLCGKIFELIKENNLTDFDLIEQKLIFNKLFNEFYQSKKNENKILFYDEEFPELISSNDNKGHQVKFIKNFVIINEETYKNLLNSMGMFKYCNQNAKKYKYAIKDEKIIIKYKNEEEKCFNLLLGNIVDQTEIFIPEILINFSDENLLKNEYNQFIDSTKNKFDEYINGLLDTKIITKIEQNFLTYNNKVKFFIHSPNNYPSLGTYVQNKKKVIKKFNKENILKAFLYYYLNNQKMISNNINDREIKENENCCCFLINKSWMDKFKNFYNYINFNGIIKSILSDEKIESCVKNYGYNGVLNNDNNIKKITDAISFNNYANNLDNLDEKNIIDELRNINLFLIDFNYYEEEIKKRNYIKIYENFELITIEKNNFIDILFPLIEMKFKKYQFLRNEENFYFFIDNNKSEKVLNACNLNVNNNDINLQLIIKGNNFDKILGKIKSNSFKNYISSLNFNSSLVAELNDSKGKGKAYLLKDTDKEISKKIKEKANLNQMLINFMEFINDIKDIKKEFKNKFNIYIVPEKYMSNYCEKYSLELSKVTEIMNKSGIGIEQKKKLLNEYVNENFSKNPEYYKKKENQKVVDSKNKKNDELYIELDKNKKIYYHDNFFILNQNTINYLDIDPNMFPKLLCYKAVNKKQIFILLFHPTGLEMIIYIGKIDPINVVRLEIVIETRKDYNYILDILQKLTIDQFISSSFVFKDSSNQFSYYSPFFDKEFNIIGNAYKPKEGQNKIEISCYNEMLINIIYLIIYFNFPKYDKMTLDKGSDYYLISEEWMKEFKTKYKYKETKTYIETSKDKNLKSVIKYEQNNKKLLNKIVCFSIGEMEDINEKYNKLHYNFEDRPSEPELSWIQDYRDKNALYFYNNFCLLDEEIHDRIFNLDKQQSKEMKNKNNYCKCYYAEGYIIIKLKKYINQLDRIILEVGKLDEGKFKLIYLLVFYSEHDCKANVELIKNMGIKNFCSNLNFQDKNIVTLDNFKGEGGKGGYIYKYSEDNINNNINDISFNINNSINPLEQQISLQNIPNQLKGVFVEHPKIGLKNIGATCYMNATIQCLCHIEKFALYFMYQPYLKEVFKKYKGKDCLSESFQELIQNLWPFDKKILKSKYRGRNANNEFYIPEKFKQKISNMNPLFQGAQANDSKDLVNFIVMRLHEELNKGIKLDDNQIINQNDEMSIYNTFCQSCFQENNSIISDLFYSVNGTVYECQRCKTKKYNFQVNFFYIFPLEEVRQYKIRQNQEQYELYINNLMANNMLDYMSAQNMLMCNKIQNQNISSVTLDDCFLYYQKMDLMTGDNAMFCNPCQRTENCVYQSYITNPPEILIIILNRGQGIQFRVKCEFVEFINIQQYVRYSNNTPYNYKLIGVVTHMGGNDSSGHFVAFCRSPIDDKWYNYNDDLCFSVNNLKNDVIDYAMPYILFYQKM